MAAIQLTNLGSRFFRFHNFLKIGHLNIDPYLRGKFSVKRKKDLSL